MTPTQRKNSDRPKSLKLQEVAQLVGGELLGDGEVVITGVAGIKDAKKGEITFLSNSKYLPFLEQTQASAVITSKEVVSKTKSLVRTSNPSSAVSKVISYFHSSESPKPSKGVHPTAVIDASAVLGKDVSVGPHAVIEKGSTIGEGSVIGANTFIGAGSVIGANVWIYPNVTIREKTEIGKNVIIHSGTVIGSDGFGYETVEGEHIKIPHTGTVLIEDDVEIGSNVCIDRGRFQKTRIGHGTKIDNLVQIAHNVVVGSNCLIVSQSGISGSTELGKNVVVAGQVGIVGHVQIGNDVVIGAGSGVTKSIPDQTVVLGSPAKPIQEQKKIYVLTGRLPELFETLAAIKKKIFGQ